MKGDAVVWSYLVNKGRSAKNRQSMAEAIPGQTPHETKVGTASTSGDLKEEPLRHDE
jgi:hypothetical protein